MKKLLSVVATVALSLGSVLGMSSAALAVPVSYELTASSTSLAAGETATLATNAPEDAIAAIFVDGVIAGDTLAASALNGAEYAWGWGVSDNSVAHTLSIRIYEPGTADIAADTVSAAAVDVVFAAQEAVEPEEKTDDAPGLALVADGANITNIAKLCDWNSNSRYIDMRTNSVIFGDVCLTSGGISDASTELRGDAYDVFGLVFTRDVGSAIDAAEYIFTADTEPVVTDHSVTFTDQGVWSSTESAFVDVTVERLFMGSWVTWNTSVVLAGTNTPANIDIQIGGNLGSDSSTRVTPLPPSGTLTDDDFQLSDPALLWVSEGAFAQSEDTDEISFGFGVTTSASLSNALIDYRSCPDRAAIDAYAARVFANFATTYNTALEAAPGACGFVFDAPAFAYSIGEEVDETFALTLTGMDALRDGFSSDVWNLPEGLDGEILTDDAGLPVAFHLYGVPDELFDDSIFVALGQQQNPARDMSQPIVAIELLPGTVTHDVVLSQEFAANIGDVAAGTEIRASALGLEAESGWTQTVRSTPQQIATGDADALGAVGGAGLIPAGLAAGWHTSTLAGTSYLGDSVTNVMWFKLDASGRLLEIRSTAPDQPVPAAPNASLASTGSNTTAGVSIAVLAALGLGAALAVAGRRRTATK
ncbi:MULTISPECIES: hypothetical protein [unclassified Leucobacter]|uniref:hypothetical protein n=1 Tax=unclassified Leucobacter TaxID=2621730 RepID=UPI00165DD2F7|nr:MULTISPECIES: hypothetical protein [unclassified Leucobacter]MBC9926887.1 hypothetical protein [Leucobacter sp. cx-169]